MSINAFKPYDSATVNSATNGSSNRVALPYPARSSDVIKVANIGTAAAFIKIGDSAVAAATATSMPVLSNSVEVFTLNAGDTHVAIIGEAGSTVYVTMGTGM